MNGYLDNRTAHMKRTLILGAALLASTSLVHAGPKDWIAYKQRVIAFTHATIVDGTGTQPKPDQTPVIDQGRIVGLGPAAGTKVPAGATVTMRAARPCCRGS